jgi:hypothetical protein
MDLVEPALEEAIVAPLVERETGVDDAVAPFDAGDDLRSIRHLRHLPLAHEARHLDPRHAGDGEPVHELGPDAGGERDRLVLEAVARADVADRDAHTTPS